MDRVRVRIGMVNFINTAPLYEVWRETVDCSDWLVIEAVPVLLNRLLFESKLDLGFISSHEYAVHPAHYRILNDLSISSTGAVGSVLLFSRVPLTQLAGKLIFLSTQSQTSVSLLKIILEEFYQVIPQYVTNIHARPPGSMKDESRIKTTEIADELHMKSLSGSGGQETPKAVLLIGDEALRLTAGHDYPFVFDLGEVWWQHTALPFVFALWAVRDKFYQQSPEIVLSIQQELLRCVMVGRYNLHDISKKVASRIPMDTADCYDYLARIEYDLGADKRRSLVLFFEYLIKRKEGVVEALPLKIV